jgi:restriction endonuclease S subunit
MSEFKRLSYEELMDVCKKKENYEYLSFNELFEIIQGNFNYTQVKIDVNSDIRMISYNNNSRITIISDVYNTNALYISQISLKNNKIIFYCEGKSIHSRNACYIKLKDNYKDLIDMKYIYHYLDFHRDFIRNNYYSDGTIVKNLIAEKLKTMIIILPPLEKQKKIVNYLINIHSSCVSF